MITVYRVTKESLDAENNVIVTVNEFVNEQDAIDFATANNLAAPEEVQKEEVQNQLAIPDVTPRQIRQALILSGVSLQSIEDAIATLPEPTKSLAQTEWEYSIAFQRNRQLVNDVGAMLGWTSQQLDDLWLFAGTL